VVPALIEHALPARKRKIDGAQAPFKPAARSCARSKLRKSSSSRSTSFSGGRGAGHVKEIACPSSPVASRRQLMHGRGAMAETEDAPVTPAVLAWAREQAGYSQGEVAERLRVKPERVQMP
jgi:hypothetical protein